MYNALKVMLCIPMSLFQESKKGWNVAKSLRNRRCFTGLIKSKKC